MTEPDANSGREQRQRRTGTHRRVEDARLMTGRGSYVGDMATEDTLHANFVRSPVAHGRLDRIVTEDAAGMSGVHAVLSTDDLGLEDLPPPLQVPRPDLVRPLLARDKVRYVGEPVAMVVADDAATAADAADLIWLEIEDLPVALANDPATADREPRLFEGSNLLAHEVTNPERTISDTLPVTVTVEVHNQRVAAMAIEGLAILCEPTPDGRLTVFCGHQAPHRLKGQLSSTLGLDASAVRVVVPDVGGAFGLKGMYFTEYAVVAAAAMQLKRPVMWLEDRREHLTAGMHGRDQVNRVTLEGDESGRIRRAHIAIAADIGAYPQSGALIPTLTRFVATGLYDIEEVTVEMNLMVTNRAPTASYRGAGRPEAAFAIERAVDEFAIACGLDPAHVRRINFIKRTQLPYRTATGAVYDSGDYAAALDLALDLADIDSLRKEQQHRLANGDDPIGLGIGAFVERTGGAADTGEFGEVEMTADGDLTVRTGSTDSGQGHKTVWSETIADVFSVDPRLVRVISGDTDEVLDGVGTYGSRSAQVGASAAYRMAIRVRDQARDMAAGILEASPNDLELAEGAFRVAGDPTASVTLADVAAEAAALDLTLRANEMFVPGTQAFPYGVHIAVVTVELETGVVNVRDIVSIDDCGNVLNETIVEGQLQGSLVQGLGQALHEAVVYDEAGVPLTSTLMDYLIPTSLDLPHLRAGRLTTPATNNPLGVKGTGEAGCIGAPPAIVNATLDALRPYGVTDLQMPLTPDRVWSALAEARDRR